MSIPVRLGVWAGSLGVTWGQGLGYGSVGGTERGDSVLGRQGTRGWHCSGSSGS